MLKYILSKNPVKTACRLFKTGRVITKAVGGDEFASSLLPLRLQIEVTDRCNFDCVMCARQTSRVYNRDISYKTFHKLIDEIQPVYVTLNGSGEPLLNKEICEMLRLCRRKGITTSMPTNMLLMEGLIADRVLENLPNSLIFSLHGATPELFRSVTSSAGFETCLKNFEKLLLKINKRHTTLRVFCTLQSLNLNHYHQMFALVKKWGLLDSFVLATVFDYGPYKSQVMPGAQQLRDSISGLDVEIKRCVDEDKRAFLNSWRQELLNLEYQASMEISSPCLLPWYSAFIRANGDVHPCCYLTGEEYVMGNIHTHLFSQIWNSAKYRDFRVKIRENRLGIKTCKSCWNDNARLIKKYSFLVGGKTKWKKPSQAPNPE